VVEGVKSVNIKGKKFSEQINGFDFFPSAFISFFEHFTPHEMLLMLISLFYSLPRKLKVKELRREHILMRKSLEQH
jgi:hypothetical protein